MHNSTSISTLHYPTLRFSTSLPFLAVINAWCVVLYVVWAGVCIVLFGRVCGATVSHGNYYGREQYFTSRCLLRARGIGQGQFFHKSRDILRVPSDVDITTLRFHSSKHQCMTGNLWIYIIVLTLMAVFIGTKWMPPWYCLGQFKNIYQQRS